MRQTATTMERMGGAIRIGCAFEMRSEAKTSSNSMQLSLSLSLSMCSSMVGKLLVQR
jgi:hypothetical protein